MDDIKLDDKCRHQIKSNGTSYLSQRSLTLQTCSHTWLGLQIHNLGRAWATDKARCSLPSASTTDTGPLVTQLWLGTEKSLANSLLAPTTCWEPQCRDRAVPSTDSVSDGGGLLHRNHILLAIEIRPGLGCSLKVQEIPSYVQNRQKKRQRALPQRFTTELLLAPALMWHNVQWQALNNNRIDSTFFSSITVFHTTKF